MSGEFSSKRELAELVSNHIFRNKNGSMNLSVVNTESVSNEFRSNRTRSGPGLDNGFLSGLIEAFNFYH